MADVNSVVEPSTPQERQLLRRKLYKRDNTLQWKDIYRERCVSRMKENRRKSLDSHRHGLDQSQDATTDAVYSIMEQEWEHLRSEMDLPSISLVGIKRKSSVHDGLEERQDKKGLFIHNDKPDDWTNTSSDSCCHDNSHDDIEGILLVIDEISVELLREQQQTLEDHEQFSERVLTATLASLSSDDIVCPLCLKSILVQRGTVIMCTCGLAIDTMNDGITLEYVRRQLHDGSCQHSQLCSGPPDFTVSNLFGINNLIMSCTVSYNNNNL